MRKSEERINVRRKKIIIMGDEENKEVDFTEIMRKALRQIPKEEKPTNLESKKVE